MKMITHKIFYIGLLICLVSLTNKVSGQFVPMQSAQYKHLAADTLYDFTGNGAPTVHPRSYKRVVTYFDSTNGIPYWHNPKTQTWVTVSGGGGPIDSSDYANLSFGYGFIIFDENPYNPATGAKAVALDTALINRYIDSVIATDTTINQNVGVFDYVVDTVSNTPPVQPDGYKVLVGTSPTGAFVGHANQVATKVGGVYTYVTPTANQSLEVRNQTQLLFYKYDGTNWHLISIGDLIGGISGIYQPDIGTRDSNSFTIKTKNIPAIRIDEAQDVYLPKFIGIPSNNFAKFDTITGKFTYDVFHPFSLTTTGTSGPATFDAETGVLNVPQYSGGAGTETWEQTLQTQGSTPFTTDNTVDFDAHSLTLNNISNLNITSNTNVTQFSLHADAENGSFENINDTLNAGMYTHIEPTVPLESFLRLRTLYAENSIVQNEQLIDVAPRYSKFSGHINNQPKAQVIFEDIDTLSTEPEFFYVSDNDTIKKYPYSGGGGGGGTTTNALTFNNSGSGDASGTTFNGGAARTLSYNSIGAYPISGGYLNSGAYLGLHAGSAVPTPTDGFYMYDSSGIVFVRSDGIRRMLSFQGVTGNSKYNFPTSVTSDTIVTRTATQTLTNKTLTSPIINVGSDATNDLYYRTSGGLFGRIPAGSDGQILTLSSGAYTWSPPNYADSALHTLYARTNGSIVTKLLLTDTVTATSTITQIPPAFEFIGNGWTGSASATMKSRIRLTGTNTTNALAQLNFDLASSGGAYTTYMTLTSSNLSVTPTITSATGVTTPQVSSSGTSSTLQLQPSTSAVSTGDYSVVQIGGTGVNQKTSGEQNPFKVKYIYNQASSTASNVDFIIDRTETSLGSGAQKFASFRVATVEKFAIDNKGMVIAQRPISFTGSAPSITAGTGAGTSPTVSVTGNDAAGYVTITTGTSPTASGNIVTITFATALTNTPKAITLTPANANAATETAKFYVDQSTASTTSWIIKNTSSGLTASTSYIYYYTITQ